MKKNNPKRIKDYKEFEEIYGKLPDISDNLKDIPCIIITGPPGCGKGTQSKIIAKTMRWKHISTGDILRQSKDPEIKKLMKSGELLPDEIAGKELILYLKDYCKHQEPEGLIFDGYPRNLDQKTIFDEICRVNKLKLGCVFFLNAPVDVLKRRIKDRGKSSNRSDDKSDKAFSIRMEEYNDKTLPMIESMRNGSNFLEISATQKLDDISEIILKKINEI